MKKEHPQFIRQRLLKDIATRCLYGAFIYPFSWITIGLVFSLYEMAPAFFYINLAIILVFAVICALNYRWVKNSEYSAKLSDQQLRASQAIILFSATQWGLITAIGIIIEDLEAIKISLLLLAVAGSISGTAIIGIVPLLRIIFPFLIIIPTIYGLLHTQIDSVEFYIFFMSCIAIYANWLGYSLHQDYWRGLSSEYEAHMRAQNYEKLANKFELLSQTDSLTGLYNRLFFNKHYIKEWKLAGRQKYNLSVLLIDIDHFKKVNDEHGHTAGDACLKAFADCLKNNVQRSGDIVARYGGEEFIVLLLGADEATGKKRANIILEAVQKLQVPVDNNKTLAFTCSIGVATTIPNYDSGIKPETLIHMADLALYSAKQSGRNRVVVHDEKMLRFNESKA